MSDGEPRSVQLSDKQLVFAFMTAAIAAVVFFLFGVFVGRGVREAKGPMVESGMAASADVVPDGAATEAPAAESGARPTGGAAGSEPLSYPDRLGKTPPAEQLKAVPPPVGGRMGDTAPPEVPEDPLPAAGAPPASRPAPAAAETGYTVQVTAVRRRDEAESIVKGLKAKGYEAYVYVPEGDNLGVFRVRIGSYKDKKQADQVAERLLREEKRYKPWVTR